ncbi:unnamed protein product [Cylindrotheca closterium]|uniref:Uncharacterized protein n=1 Tax=Cylindrotheca closterium TaxID=2856 RepID=A0AAD2CQP2_9STRA|nr:unnamed protein product [Cylindrotheca closterium]
MKQPDVEAPSTAPNTPQRQPIVRIAGANTNGQIYGASNYMKAGTYGNVLLGETEFEDFAPARCVCCGCFVNDKMRKRTYYRVYENRFEYNEVNAPCLCFSKERCIGDYTRVHYFDQQPSRSANVCGCIPCICCGPPVVYYHVPKLWGCFDLRSCFGEGVYSSPCNCFDLRVFICIGRPCYQMWACRLARGTKNTEAFVSKWRGAVEEYGSSRGIPKEQQAVFRKNVDRICSCDYARTVPATHPADAAAAAGAPVAVTTGHTMER